MRNQETHVRIVEVTVGQDECFRSTVSHPVQENRQTLVLVDICRQVLDRLVFKVALNREFYENAIKFRNSEGTNEFELRSILHFQTFKDKSRKFDDIYM